MFPTNVLMFGAEMLELRRILFEAVFPGFVVFALWLDGWFYSLVLLPLLYVKFVDRRGLEWIGFHGKSLFSSGLLGVCSFLGIILVWYLFFIYYLPPLESVSVNPYVLFTDAFWYPFYEEVAYRGFALAHLVPGENECFFCEKFGWESCAGFAFCFHPPQVCYVWYASVPCSRVAAGFSERIHIFEN